MWFHVLFDVDTEGLAPVAHCHLLDHLVRNRDIPFPLVSCRVPVNLMQTNTDLLTPGDKPVRSCGSLLLNRTCESGSQIDREMRVPEFC